MSLFLFFNQLVLLLLYTSDRLLREDKDWNHQCVGIEAMVELNQLASTAGSLPKVARIDLAALVLNKKKLNTEPIRFGNNFLSKCLLTSFNI